MLEQYVIPALGHMKLTEVEHEDVEALVAQVKSQGKSASTVHNVLDPLRCIYRRAVKRGIVAADPCKGLELEKPAKRDLHDRIPSVEQARALIDALPEDRRALWATAAYAGLRHGELRALRVADVDLDARRIHVGRGWDDKAGAQEPKTKNAKRKRRRPRGTRADPARAPLRTGRRGDDLRLGATATEPFPSATERRNARRAWEAENERRKARGEAPLPLLGFHDLRHAFASLAIEAGANPKRLQAMMGHASLTETFDTYGHLWPDGEDDLLARMDAFMARERPALRVVGG